MTKDFTTNIIQAVEEVLEFIKRHINMEVVIEKQARRKEIWSYPMEALREAVINAIVHRDYTDKGNIQIRIFDNRIEIWGTGALPKEININRLPDESRSIPYNKTIARIFYSVKLIENWGTGFYRMVNACVKNNNPPPQFELKTNAFVITFLKNKLNEGLNQLLQYITQNPGKRLSEISKAFS